MFEMQERKTVLSEMSPYKPHVGLGEGHIRIVLKNQNSFLSLLCTPGRLRYKDKYTLLVRLILWWVRGCRSGVLVSVFSAGEKAGPSLGH